MVESNKLMAEFLGYSYHHKHNQFYFAGWSKGKSGEYLCRTHQQLKFDTDWNWLMKVVEKIENLGFTIHVGGHMCKIENIEKIVKAITLQPTKIQAVYSACLQFLQNESIN